MTPHGLSATRTEAWRPGNSITTVLLFIELLLCSWLVQVSPYSRNTGFILMLNLKFTVEIDGNCVKESIESYAWGGGLGSFFRQTRTVENVSELTLPMPRVILTGR